RPSLYFILLLEHHLMVGRFLRKLLPSRKTPVKTSLKRWPRFIPSFDRLEERLNPGSASPANVTAVYDAGAHQLKVSFQEAVGSTDTPEYGAVFLEPAEVSSTGGITITGTLTNGSKTVTFGSGTTTLGLLVGQTVTGTGIQTGTTVASVDSSSQVTL